MSGDEDFDELVRPKLLSPRLNRVALDNDRLVLRQSDGAPHLSLARAAKAR